PPRSGPARGASAEDSHAERLLAGLGPDAALVTVIDGHPASLSWLGGVAGQRVYPLGVDHFGQSGDIPDLYRLYRLDADAIIDAAATACLERRSRAGEPRRPISRVSGRRSPPPLAGSRIKRWTERRGRPWPRPSDPFPR